MNNSKIQYSLKGDSIMGVSYYACKCCGESMYSEYVGNCTNCGIRLCTDCLINNDVESRFAYEYGAKFDGSQEMIDEYNVTQEEIEKGYVKIGELIDDTAILPKYCPFCQGEEINEKEFIEFLIKKLATTREFLEKEFLRNK
jgi:hypothetical protein